MQYIYIHIWASDKEIRIQCTDPKTINLLNKSVKENFEDSMIALRNDLDEEPYIARITAMELRNRHQKIAWWLFKLLCEHGWEPMETGNHWYKLKYSIS